MWQGEAMTEAIFALGSPPGAPAHDTARVYELLAALRRLAVDQPLLELRLGELSSLLTEMLE
jgi:hypothetical protein